MSLLLKDPDSRISYRLNWGAAGLGDALIMASSWSVVPEQEGGIAIAASSHDDHSATATLTGGQAGASYALVNRVTLSTGEIDERSVAVRVEQR